MKDTLPMEPRAGHRFGWTAIMGPPNAGKSTLLNTILGQKVAIVSPRPQTTRNQISGILTRPEVQIVFLDTPGVHRLRGRLNRFLLESAWQALSQANAAIIVADAALYCKKAALMEQELAPLRDKLASAGLPTLVALNKIDQVKEKGRLLPLMAAFASMWPEAEIFPLSARTGKGVEELLARVTALMPEGEAAFPEDQLSTAPLRFLAAETVREKLFLTLREELPYQTAVVVESWEEEPPAGPAQTGLIRVSCVIYVGAPTHKAMVIGRGGENLKRMGRDARLEIEKLTGMKVFLELWVKVRENWTEDRSFLHELGFGRGEPGAFGGEDS